MSYGLIQDLETDPFGSQTTVSPVSVMNFKPTWGVSELRYSKTETGTGAAADEDGGEFKLSSGTATSNVVQVQTLQRGQYQAGTLARFGIGVRLPVAPTGTQDVQWGYLDANNALFYGQNSTGIYVARRSGGSTTPYYQSAWNLDTLDGSKDENNPSGLTLNLANGVICQCPFTWYAYGVIRFGIIMYDSTDFIFKVIYIHEIKVDTSVSIIDPNQPLTFRVENGASTSTNLDLYIGGHQFEYFHGKSTPQRRKVPELLTDFTTAGNTSWQPLIAIRKKATHGPSGRTNSVTCRITGFELAGDGEMEVRLTYGGTTSNLSWATPTGWTAAESAIETKVTGGTALTTSADGFPIEYDFVTASRASVRAVEDITQLDLGADKEAILWIRRLSASGTMIVKHAHIDVEEEW